MYPDLSPIHFSYWVITQPVVRWTRLSSLCGGGGRHPRQAFGACLIYQRFQTTRKFTWKYLDLGHIFSFRYWLNKTGHPFEPR